MHYSVLLHKVNHLCNNIILNIYCWVGCEQNIGIHSEVQIPQMCTEVLYCTSWRLALEIFEHLFPKWTLRDADAPFTYI